MWIQQLVDVFGWKAFGELSEQVREEQCFWRDEVDSFNGQPIRCETKITTVDKFVYSDVGGYMLGGTLCRKGKEEVQYLSIYSVINKE